MNTTLDQRFYTSLNGRTIEAGLLHFTKSSCLDVAVFGADADTAESYRAHWLQLPDGEIQITKIERNDARPGKPDYWVVDVMSRLEVRALETIISDQLSREGAGSEYERAVEKAAAQYDPFAMVSL
jgi:hypothetical protein